MASKKAELNLQDLQEMQERCDAAEKGPWSACNNGNCQCAMVRCPDYPIAEVTIGKWGDRYPAIRLDVSQGTIGAKAEAYMEMIEYGEISKDLSKANQLFIANSRTDMPRLLAFARERLEQDARRRGEGLRARGAVRCG